MFGRTKFKRMPKRKLIAGHIYERQGKAPGTPSTMRIDEIRNERLRKEGHMARIVKYPENDRHEVYVKWNKGGN